MSSKRAIIIGAGHAGLTAAYELLNKTDIKPIIIEASKEIVEFQKHTIIRAIEWTWEDIDSSQSLTEYCSGGLILCRCKQCLQKMIYY
jgi:thioredoxin reductase